MQISEKSFQRIENEYKSEQGFWKLFTNSVFISGDSKRQIITRHIWYFALTIAFYFALTPSLYLENNTKIVEKILDMGFGISLSILGFLITGFAIYATFSDKEFMYFLTINIDKKTGFNKHHLNHLYFYHPFMVFLLLLSISTLGKIYLAVLPGVIDAYFDSIKEDAYNTINSTYAVMMSAYFWLICVALNSLKCFLYNIYTASKTVSRLYFRQRSKGYDMSKMIKSIDENNIKEIERGRIKKRF